MNKTDQVVNTVCWRRRLAGLPGWLRHALNHSPRRGGGLHSWLFSTARQLHAHFSQDEICELFRQLTEGDEREIQDAVYNSLDCAWQPKRAGRLPARQGHDYKYGQKSMSAPNWRTVQAETRIQKTAPSRWPAPDLARIEEIVAAGRGVAGQ